MLVIPVCLRCKHLKKGMKCRAYPQGIPSEILSAQKNDGILCMMFEKRENGQLT